MIHIEVDYQGERSIETTSFTSTGAEFQKKLDEIESYNGKIDRVKVYVGKDKVGDMWDEIPSRTLVDSTNVGSAIRRARKLQYVG